MLKYLLIFTLLALPAHAELEHKFQVEGDQLSKCQTAATPAAKSDCYKNAQATFKEYANSRMENGKPSPFSMLKGHRTKKAILFVHSYTMSPEEMLQYAGLFAKEDYNMISVLLEAHGPRNSDRGGRLSLGEVTPEDWTKDASFGVNLAQALGDEVIVVGYSLGGLLSLQAAIEHPEKIQGVVAIAPALAVGDSIIGNGASACLGSAIVDTALGDKLFGYSKNFVRGSCALVNLAEKVNPTARMTAQINQMRDGESSEQAVMQVDYALQQQRQAFRKMKVPYLMIIAKNDTIIDFDTLVRFTESSSARGKLYLLEAGSHFGYNVDRKNSENRVLGATIHAFVSSLK
jgi:esterase/lipase